VFKVIFKWIKRVVLVLLLVFIIVPYFIVRDGNQEIPAQPFSNSMFVNTSQGVSIHTRIYEPTQPIIGQIMLVHGLGGSTFSYEDNAPFLASLGYFVVTVDLPAFGFSSKQRGLIHSQDNRAMWLWDVLNQIEVLYRLKPSWVLGGHSMGGSVALAMNNAQPIRTAGLILIDPAIPNDVDRNAVLSWVVKSTPVGEWLRVFLTYGLLQNDSFQSSLSSAYGVEATPQQVEAYLRPLRTKGSTQALREFFATAQGLSVSQWLYPNTPVILIWGEKDAWIPIANKDEILGIATDVIDIVLENEGHNPMETNPTFFNERLARALSQWANDKGY
jgi:2-hydroxy-6-oxonona-2,4-dienedioate hydrolase